MIILISTLSSLYNKVEKIKDFILRGRLMVKLKKFFIHTPLYVFLGAILILTIFPVVYVILASFKSNQEILSAGANLIPKKITLENYKLAWVLADFKQYTWNSVYMSSLIVLGTIITSSMGGYVFSRGKFPGKRIIFALFTSTMFISMGSVTIYPLLQICRGLHINNSLWGVIIINVFGLHITNLYLVKGFIDAIPYEVDEASKMDGCSFFRIYWNIIFPLLKPIIATVALITFRTAWNDYLLPLVFTLARPKQAPLVVGLVALKGSGEAASSWNLMMAGSAISMVPMLTIYFALNRYFISGLTTGAVKG